MLPASGIRAARAVFQKENLTSPATVPTRMLALRKNIPKNDECSSQDASRNLWSAILDHVERTTSQECRATPNKEPGPVMPDLYVTSQISILIQPSVQKPVSQIFFPSMTCPKFNGTRFYNFITKTKNTHNNLHLGHKHDLMIYPFISLLHRL